MPRSRAIDHCRESHAFAQVSVQGSFPPLRCTNPPRAHASRGCVCVRARVCISVGTTHEGENAERILERRSSSRIDDFFILALILEVFSRGIICSTK